MNSEFCILSNKTFTKQEHAKTELLIKNDIISHRCWIRSVVKSVNTPDQLESAERLVGNWKTLTYQKIDSFKPSFFSSNSGWRSLLELFIRVEKEIESHLAGKKALIRIKHLEDVYENA
jgi:hypothetical protein